MREDPVVRKEVPPSSDANVIPTIASILSLSAHIHTWPKTLYDLSLLSSVPSTSKKVCLLTTCLVSSIDNLFARINNLSAPLLLME